MVIRSSSIMLGTKYLKLNWTRNGQYPFEKEIS